MRYALFGDLHSNIEDTKAVLFQIETVAPDAALFCLGDLYECKISKKKAETMSNVPLTEAAIVETEFEALLTFPSIRGNQEERISKITGFDRFAALPQAVRIDGATLVHGHQIQWNENWEPTEDASSLEFHDHLLFFGHSHRSGLYRKGKRNDRPIVFGEERHLVKNHYWINVGSVVDHREWCLYDSEARTITFMKTI